MPEGNYSQDIGEDAEDEVIRIIKKISLQSLGTRWKVLEINPDIGEDRLVRIYKNGRSLPLHFFIQIKGQRNLQRSLIDGVEIISLPLETKHINDWMHFTVPVVIMLCDMSTLDQNIYWEILQDCLDEYTYKKMRQKEFSIHIPVKNVLDKEGLKRIAVRTKKHFTVHKQQKQYISDMREIVSKYQPVDIDDPRDDLITWETKNTVGIRFCGRRYEELVANETIKQIMQKEDISLEEYLRIRILRISQLFAKAHENGCDTLALVDSEGNIKKVINLFDDTTFPDDLYLEDYEHLEDFE